MISIQGLTGMATDSKWFFDIQPQPCDGSIVLYDKDDPTKPATVIRFLQIEIKIVF